MKKVLFKILQNSQKNTCARVLFLKKRLWHWCFPVYFANFLRTPLLQNISGRLLLISRRVFKQWLFLVMFAVTQTIFFSHKLSFLETIEHIDYKIKLKCHEKSFFSLRRSHDQIQHDLFCVLWSLFGLSFFFIK